MRNKTQIVEAQDIPRWVTFGGFWGFVFYLLSLVGILTSHRNQPARVNMRTVLVGLGLQILSFIGFTTVFSIGQAAVVKKSSTRLARERISGGSFVGSFFKLGLSASLVSLLPFGFAVGNMKTAERITGEPAFENAEEINWPKAVGVATFFSGLTGLAVARITSWVAQDAIWKAEE